MKRETKCIYFWCVIIFSYCLSFAQTNINVSKKLDSLWSVYNNDVQPVNMRLKAIHTIAWSLRNNNPDTSIILAQQQLQLAKETKQRKYVGKAFTTIGVSYRNKGDYPKALENLLSALKVFEETDNKEGLGLCYNQIGHVYNAQSNYSKALEYYLKALKVLEGADKQWIGDCYNNLGNIHEKQSDLTKALDYYLKSLKISEGVGDKQGEGECYNNIGNVYETQIDYLKALEYYEKALRIWKEYNNNKGIKYCYIKISILCGKLKDSKMSKKYNDSAKSVK